MSYIHYEGRSVGRLLYFLQEYAPPVYNDVIFNLGGVITYRGQPFATVEWDDRDIPIFKFVNPVYNERQEQLREQVVERQRLFQRINKARENPA